MPYYFRATAMALLGLVRPALHCYFADSDAESSPEVMADLDVGGIYEVHASVLRSSGLCGGPLGISTAAGSGSGLAVAVFGSSLKGLG